MSTIIPAAEQRKIKSECRRGSILIVTGETGSGKSTEVPKLLLSHPKETVIVSQPRRVAAISLAKRVAVMSENELGKDSVGYSIRFESTTTKKTRIIYATDGVLLKWIEGKKKLDIVVLDEVHERSIRTDILLALLKKKVNQMKIVLMSATADLSHLTEYFLKDKIPVSVVNIPGRAFPVEIKYIPRPSSDYIQMAYNVISMITRGSNSNYNSDDFNSCKANLNLIKPTNPTKSNNENSVINEIFNGKSINSNNSNNSNNKSTIQRKPSKNTGTILVFLSGIEDINDLYRMVILLKDTEILKLHSSLDDQEQKKVFKRREKRIRVILSTNIAETSITIPDVYWVIDTGVQKRNITKEGIDCLGIVSISKSSAKQRAGRAGRIAPGICYRLYTQEAYKKMDSHTVPEILCTDTSTVTLSLIKMKEDPITFDFLQPPDKAAILSSLRRLFLLRLIDRTASITKLGISASEIPLSPALAKFLLLGKTYEVPCSAAALCAFLSSGNSVNGITNTISNNSQLSEIYYPSKEIISDIKNHSDLTICVSVFFSFMALKYDSIQNADATNTTNTTIARKEFCTENGLCYKSLTTAERIYKQLLSFITKSKSKSNNHSSNWKKEIQYNENKNHSNHSNQYNHSIINNFPKRVAQGLHLSASAAFLTGVAERVGSGREYIHLYTGKPIWIDPCSFLFSHPPPQIGFITTYQGAKPYALYLFPFIESALLLTSTAKEESLSLDG